MQTLPAIDILVLILYLAAVVGLGCWLSRRNRTTNDFMAAGGTLPGWAVGLSIFGTYLSSNTFIGVPGKADGWPQQPVDYIIPFGYGGESGIAARMQQPVFTQLTGHDLVISHKPGGGGAVVFLGEGLAFFLRACEAVHDFDAVGPAHAVRQNVGPPAHTERSNANSFFAHG